MATSITALQVPFSACILTPGGSVRKLIFVTGGVLSGLGKGVITASIGLLFKLSGYKVSLQKIDPYLNLDAGTMNPYEHGEVFVTRDGMETDLDIGRYERFLGEELTAVNYMTTGQVYWNVIRKERAGEFLGKTVQVIPHITDEIKGLILRAVEGAEIGVVEIGGTVGDIESLPFLEALRQLRDDLPREDTFFVHLTLLPRLSSTDELKTKPTQHSVKELRAIGIQPDAIVARADGPLPDGVRRKIARFCDVPMENVIEDPDLDSIYAAPLVLHDQGLDDRISCRLGLPAVQPDLSAWTERLARLRNPTREVQIGIVGKYVELEDSYISIREALIHAGIANDARVEMLWIPAEAVARDGPEKHLEGIDGLLVPGGFGDRGIEGKVEAISYVRKRKIPFFGICLGLQCAVIEFARDRLGLPQANSSEFDPHTPDPVIDLLPDQADVRDKGGTMRLGEYETVLKNGTRAYDCYRADRIRERHRHRYEFNPDYREAFEAAGMVVSGTSPDGRLVEIIELPDHPWYVGVQFHPEFTSRFLFPHPLFSGFVEACLRRRDSSSSS